MMIPLEKLYELGKLVVNSYPNHPEVVVELNKHFSVEFLDIASKFYYLPKKLQFRAMCEDWTPIQIEGVLNLLKDDYFLGEDLSLEQETEISLILGKKQ